MSVQNSSLAVKHRPYGGPKKVPYLLHPISSCLGELLPIKAIDTGQGGPMVQPYKAMLFVQYDNIFSGNNRCKNNSSSCPEQEMIVVEPTLAF